MNKQVKLTTSTVKNEKLTISSASVEVPFALPDLNDARPLKLIVVTLTLSDNSLFERAFDYIPDCPIDNYIKIAVSIFNQLQSVTSDSSK